MLLGTKKYDSLYGREAYRIPVRAIRFEDRASRICDRAHCTNNGRPTLHTPDPATARPSDLPGCSEEERLQDKLARAMTKAVGALLFLDLVYLSLSPLQPSKSPCVGGLVSSPRINRASVTTTVITYTGPCSPGVFQMLDPYVGLRHSAWRLSVSILRTRYTQSSHHEEICATARARASRQSHRSFHR